MAKYRHYDYGQAKMLPVRFEEQILPGTFEYTLNRLIDERFNLEVFDAHYKNDETGAPAYDPAILLKIILYAYARGVTSSREIERLCRENVVFMALSADSRPHFTTIAAFIARLGDPIVSVFRDVLLVCDETGVDRAGDVCGGWGEAPFERFQGVERNAKPTSARRSRRWNGQSSIWSSAIARPMRVARRPRWTGHVPSRSIRWRRPLPRFGGFFDVTRIKSGPADE